MIYALLILFLAVFTAGVCCGLVIERAYWRRLEASRDRLSAFQSMLASYQQSDSLLVERTGGEE